VAAVVVADEAVVDGEKVVLIALPWDRTIRVTPDVCASGAFRVAIDDVRRLKDRDIAARYPGAIERKGISDAVVSS
jgi:hypothetical protein